MRKINPVLLILMLTVACGPALAMPQGISTISIIQLRTADKSIQVAEFKKEKKYKKTSNHKNTNRARDKRKSSDGIITDETQTVRERIRESQDRQDELQDLGPDVQQYHRKKRTTDHFKK